MSGSYHDPKQPPRKADDAVAGQKSRAEPMDEEEKILAGRKDVNMPALLTRDVQGG